MSSTVTVWPRLSSSAVRQTSSTISVRTSVGRCKSPGIVEFENSEGMGPVDVEAADTNQVGNTLIAARRAPSFARVKFNLEATAQTNGDMGDFGGSLLLFFFLPHPPSFSLACLLHDEQPTPLLLIPQIGSIRSIVQFPLHLAAVAPNLACRLGSAAGECVLGRAAQWKRCYLARSRQWTSVGRGHGASLRHC